ncbi:MAG TPA: septum formation initiator family protein [Myxococcota bacterium]
MRGWLWIPALAGMVLAVALLDGDSGLGTWLRLRAELADARGRIAGIRDEADSLARQADALEGDDFAIERAIREELEYARSGETLLRLLREDDVSSRFP